MIGASRLWWYAAPLTMAAACATAHEPGQPGDPDARVIVPGDPDARVIGPGDPDARVTPDVDGAPVGGIDGAPVGGIDGGAIDGAPVGTPDAASPCTPTTVELLVNRSFDLGPSATWVESSGGGYPIIVIQDDGDGVLEDGELNPALVPHSPAHAVWLGGYYDGVDTLTQTFAVPAGTTSLQVSGQRWFASEEVSAGFDDFTIELRSNAGATLETLFAWDAIDATTAWTPFSRAAAGSYAGQTVRLHIESSVDFSFNSNFFLDTFSVTASVCM